MALMSVAAARDRILGSAVPLEAELVHLDDAAGRILAEDLRAALTQPPFDASAMDGYAVRAADVANAPARLRLIGAAAAGHAFSGALHEGEAVRIFTGAPLPAGADTVVIQENTRVPSEGAVEILEAAKLGRNVRSRGYDFKEGETLIAAGTRLNGRHLMLAAATNRAAIPVRRKPSVAVLATGDELVSPGAVPRADQIISSIPSGLKTAIASWGAEARILDIARDNRESLARLAAEAGGADILLTIGGASVGEHDLVRGVLEEAGARFEVLKIAMRPGKPLMFGFKGTQRVLSLPGNPVSAMICARIFLKPLLDRLLGANERDLIEEKLLAAPLEANGEREHYMRAIGRNGTVEALADQDSSLMKAFAEADCLIVRPSFAPPLPSGALVPTIKLDF
jgi:molybdopterin molybdotransferase